METTRFVQFFWLVVEQLPSLITIVACLAFVIKGLTRSPKVSLLALIGLALLLLHGIFFSLIYAWVVPLMYGAASSGTIDNIRLVIGMIYNITLAIAFLPLVTAVFSQRRPVVFNVD